MYDHEETGEKLIAAMLATFEAEPKAAEVTGPHDLFAFTAFQLGELEPTFGQACAALQIAQSRWRARAAGYEPPKVTPIGNLRDLLSRV